MLIALVGFTGAGKSTIGRKLSLDYGLSCYDSDKLIEEHAGLSVGQLFATRKEQAFRDLEEASILECVQSHSCGVLVTGGGAVLRETTRILLRDKCFTVCIHAPLDVIWERLQHALDRPLLQGSDPHKALFDLYEKRAGVYDFAHESVSSENLSVACSRIVAHWLQFS